MLAGLTDGQIERFRVAELARLAREQGRSLRQIARLFRRSPAWAAKVTGEKVSAADCRKSSGCNRGAGLLAPKK